MAPGETANSDAPMRVLVIDDDRKLCGLIQEYLEPLGYKVTLTHTGPDGLEAAKSGEFDVAILDVMLPGMDGFDVLKELRKDSDLPVLMLTSRGDETDRIVGLEIGADDYVPKTFSTRELLARLRAVTRRAGRQGERSAAKSDDVETIHVGPLRVETASRTAYIHEALVELTPLEYELLVALSRAVGRVLSRDQLMDKIAGREYDVFDRSIDVHVSSLRRKLGDDPKSPRYIKTVRSVGYMFLSPDDRDA